MNIVKVGLFFLMGVFVGPVSASVAEESAYIYLQNVKAANLRLCLLVKDDLGVSRVNGTLFSEDFTDISEAQAAIVNYIGFYRILELAMERYMESDAHVNYESKVITDAKKAAAYRARISNVLRQGKFFLEVASEVTGTVKDSNVGREGMGLDRPKNIYSSTQFVCSRLKTALENYFKNY